MSFLFLVMTFSLFAETKNYIAVFSEQQTLWPALTHKKNALMEDSLQIGIMPLQIKDYQESKPCDSCHRLSANGLEFFLENYWLNKMQSLLPKSQVQLIAPQNYLLQSKAGFSLDTLLDSLNFPVEKWFYGFQEDFIYRSHDAITPMLLKEKLNRIGGALGLTHLLLPFKAWVRVYPLISDGHTGGLSYAYFVLLWNVREGHLEWVFKVNENISLMDLDTDLTNRMDQNVLPYFKSIPKKLVDLWSQEAH